MASLPISEADLERTCSDLLAYDGWRPLKTDPVSRREWGKGFGEKGMADHLYIRYTPDRAEGPPQDAEVMWIEWKRPPTKGRAGGKLQPHQAKWIQAERERGALVFVAGQDFERTFDAFLQWYRQSGLRRRANL